MKVFAYIFMIIDHYAIFVDPSLWAFRWIGRVAFPLYLSMLLVGYAHTRSLPKYIGRLCFWGVVSQLTIWVGLGFQGHLDVLFTLALCLLTVYTYDLMQRYSVFYRWSVVLIYAYIATILSFDYGYYAPIAVTALHAQLKKFWLVLHFIYSDTHHSQMVTAFYPWLLKRLPHSSVRVRVPSVDWYCLYALQFVVFSFLNNV